MVVVPACVTAREGDAATGALKTKGPKPYIENYVRAAKGVPVTTNWTGVWRRLLGPRSAAATIEAVEVELGSNNIWPETLAEPKPDQPKLALLQVL